MNFITLRKNSGFTLVELLAIIFIAFAIVAACGWGLAFAFSVKVLVPWLGVSAAYANAAALGLSFALTGVATIVILVVLALFGTTLAALFRRRR